MKKNLIVAVCAILLSFSAVAQSYKGLWHGYITAEGLVNKSLYALDVKTHEGNIITGRTYLYNNYLFVFYGVFDFIGTIDGKNVKITELRLGEYEIPFNSLCLKFANVSYFKKDGKEFLEGVWDNQKSNCAVANVMLNRLVPGETDPDLPGHVLTKINEDKTTSIKFKETILTKPFVLNITKPTIKIELRDYLREDNDTVTVFVNRDEVIRGVVSHIDPIKKR